ncbi:MAG: sialate O-acetylesterase [Gemmataceae bacterium]|nr:sialate O-acetylesterase [Gemmata sp.]MDW8198177.1 sialate O-acetylesterase [Gemmataceae bacterium]
MKRFLALVGVVLGAAPLPAADLKLAAIFADHMVLQRDKPVPVWGWADPHETITVSFAGQTHTTVADAHGRWQVQLDKLAASAEPRSLVAASSRGQCEVKDVLVGEVWLGSGQSNMAMTVNRCRDFATEKAAAQLPQIRLFKENSPASPTPSTVATGTWTVCSPETVGGFSATLYFFGRVLYRELKVPIGLINASVGGTPIESWIAAEVQAAVPELKLAHEANMQAYKNFDVEKAKANYAKALARWREQVEAAHAAGQMPPPRPTDPVAAHERRGPPGGLFNGKIHPLIPFAIRGVLWYQGEANTHSPERAALYHHQLKALVTDWRRRWGEELPCAWVQLPNFERPGEGWSLVQEGMLQTLQLPNTGMAITIDIGDPKDIHPVNKQEVGRRLALWALGRVYGRQGIATSGPLPAQHVVRAGAIVVSFLHTDGGLRADGDVKGFEIAGADGVWKPATARIEGDTVVVSHPEVKEPVAVRYAWASNPTCNLLNGHGLPASPFRIRPPANR